MNPDAPSEPNAALDAAAARVAAEGYYPDGSPKMSHVIALALHGCPPPSQPTDGPHDPS